MASHSAWRRSATLPLRLKELQHNQRRHKMFVRATDEHGMPLTDEDGKPYYLYSRNSWPAPPPPSSAPSPVPSPAPATELFQISSLLLDLDAEGSQYVRAYSPEDEERLVAIWDSRSAISAAHERTREFSDRLQRMRRNHEAILTQSTHELRLTRHDIFTTAFYGAPRQEPARDSLSRQASTEQDLGPANGSILKSLAAEDVIPPQALKDDQSLLRWMFLRYQNLLESRTGLNHNPPTAEHLSMALERVNSIGSLRHLIFQCLDQGMDINLFGHKASNEMEALARQVRETCKRILSENNTDLATWFEASTMIGNLSARLAKHDLRLNTSLQGLGLALAAELGVVDASYEYLYNGILDNMWTAGLQELQDVLSALESYNRLLNTGRHRTALGHLLDRRKLLQLVTGLDDNQEVGQVSFRSLVMTYQTGVTKMPEAQAMDAYMLYIAILGHLGALSTIWKEWRESAHLVSGYIGNIGRRDGHSEADNLASSFLAAFQESSRTSHSESNNLEQDLGLEDCVALDLKAMPVRTDESWNEEQTHGTQNKVTPFLASMNPVALRDALNLSLREWLAKAGSLSRA